jgi:hypothetical protein
MSTTTTDILTEYREQKKKIDQLAAAARKQMQSRYTALLTEAAELQGEFKTHFGASPELPGTVKTFTVGENKKPTATDAQATGKKIGGLRRSLNAALKKGDIDRSREIASQLTALGVPDFLPPDTKPADVIPDTAEVPDSLAEVFGV